MDDCGCICTWHMRIGGPCRECGGSGMMHYERCKFAGPTNTIKFDMTDLIEVINKVLEPQNDQQD